MAIDDKILTSFADAINNPGEEDRSNKPKVSYVYAQAVSKMTSNNVVNIKIDGSEIQCPVNSNVTVDEGDRVLVMLRNHNATVVGNATTPSTTIDYMKSGDGKSLIVDQVKDYIEEALDDLKGSLFPIGSTYITIVKVSPATFLGGTWTLLNEGYALMSVTNEDAGGQYDSIASNTKTVSGVPVHSHAITVNTDDGYIPTVSTPLPSHDHYMPIYSTGDARSVPQDMEQASKNYGLPADTLGFRNRVMVKKGDGASVIYDENTEGITSSKYVSIDLSHFANHLEASTSGSGEGTVNVTPKNFKVYVWYRTA